MIDSKRIKLYRGTNFDEKYIRENGLPIDSCEDTIKHAELGNI